MNYKYLPNCGASIEPRKRNNCVRTVEQERYSCVVCGKTNDKKKEFTKTVKGKDICLECLENYLNKKEVR